MTDAALVLLGGDVRTQDARSRTASAVAIGDGLITAVGSDEEISRLRGPGTEVVHLKGRTVLPGINDSHAHVGWWALATAAGALDVRAGAAPSVAAVQELVREAAARTPRGDWILGYGWDASRYPGGALPTGAALDAAAPDHPVALTHFSGHALWANGEALRRAGIDRATRVPPGSVLVRDPVSGDPTGVLVEPGATGLVARCMARISPAELADVLEDAIASLHERGITSFTEPALAPGDPDRAFTGAFIDAYALLARSGRLRARVSVLEFFHRDGVTSADDVRAGVAERGKSEDVDPRRLRISGVKIFADGVFSARTSWLREDYVGGGRGSLVVAGADEQARLAELRGAIAVAHAAGRQVQVHATGDAAIEATVDALVDAMRAAPREDPRHVVIHGVLAGRDHLQRMRDHGILLNVQPTIARLVGGNLFGVLGERRAADASPLRWAHDVGLEVALSTDIPIAPEPDWRATVVDAVTRRTETGPAVERQRASLDEALRGVTAAGAWQDRAESWKGSIEPGKVADLCVMGGRIDEHRIDALASTPVVATVFDGTFVHRSGLEQDASGLVG